jgi:CheY-like chemotaxis protein
MSDTLEFASEAAAPEAPPRRPWTLLIVDDDQEVHAVTMLALDDFRLCGRELRFLHAYSAREAREMLALEQDVALVLLDVVMESDNAGLEVVEYVRNVLHNRFIRIVLRTGQPGQAPELEVIRRYDINGYNHKTELTREKLHTTVYTSLSAYRDLMALEANRRGLEKIIDSTARLFEADSIARFAQGVLEQLIALLFVESDAVMVSTSGLAAASQRIAEELRIVAATGAFESCVGHDARETLPEALVRRILAARNAVGLLYGEDYIVGYQSAHQELVFYVSADGPLSLTDRHLLEMFYRNVGIAYRNLQRVAALARGTA